MIKDLRNKCVEALNGVTTNFMLYLPVALLGIILCFSINAIFGDKLVVVGLVSLFTVKDLYKTTFSLPNYLRYAVFLLLIVTLGTFASMNVFIGIIINFAVLAYLSFVHCDNFTMGSYFSMALQLLLMQYPGRVSITDLPARLLCCLFCVVVCGVFLMLFNNIFRKHKDNKYVLRGCNAIANKLKLLLDDNVADKTDMFILTTDFCKSNYKIMTNQGYLLDESVKHEFLALMTMEQMSDLIYDTATKLGTLTDKDREYFKELMDMFSHIKTLKRLSINISNFVDDYSLSNPQLSSLWRKYILTLAGHLKYKSKPVMKGNIKESAKFRISVLKKRFNLTSYNFRNALQISIIVTLCAVVAHLVPIAETMLAPIVALAVLSIYPEEKLTRTLPGAVGVIIIAMLYMFVLGAVPFVWRLPVALILSMFGLAIAKGPFVQLAFATQLISAVMYPTAVIGMDALIKVAFVVAGCIFGRLLVRWIFNTPQNRKYKLHISDLAQFDWTAIHLLEQVRLDNGNENYLCEFMMIQHLMVEHISNSSNEKVDSNKIRYSSMLSFNCDLLTEIAYAITILRPNKIPKDWILAMKKRLTNIF